MLYGSTIVLICSLCQLLGDGLLLVLCVLALLASLTSIDRLSWLGGRTGYLCCEALTYNHRLISLSSLYCFLLHACQCEDDNFAGLFPFVCLRYHSLCWLFGIVVFTLCIQGNDSWLRYFRCLSTVVIRLDRACLDVQQTSCLAFDCTLIRLKIHTWMLHV